MAAPLRSLGSALRSPVWKSKVTNVFAEKRYISYRKNRGIWLADKPEGKNRYEEFKSFLHKKWSGIDRRLGKLEDHVSQSDKEFKEFKDQVQIESQNSEKQFRKYSQESHANHLKVNSDLNELKLLKDLWLSSLYTRSSEDVLIPSPKEINVKESDDELKVLFDLIDKDHDGYLSLPEIHDLAASLKEKLSKEEVDKLIHEAGHDVKGGISSPELRNLIGK